MNAVDKEYNASPPTLILIVERALNLFTTVVL